MLTPSSTLGTNSSEVKLQNMSAILLTLLSQPNISRVHLAQQIGVSTSTITNLVTELMEMGLVNEDGLVQTDGQASVGRPQRALQLVPQARYALGVHISVGRVHVVLADMTGEMIHPADAYTFDHALDAPWQQVLDTIIQQINRLQADLTAYAIDAEQIIGVGVAASGLVDPYTGVNVIAPNLNWHDVAIKDYLETRLGLPVIVENNVRAMALAESMFGCAQHVYTTAFVYGLMGVGAGFTIGGQVFRGAAAGAGEIGHNKVVFYDDNGPQVRALEDVISEVAIVREAAAIAQHDPNSPIRQMIQDKTLTLDAVFDAARGGDVALRTMLDDRAFHMGIALSNLVNMFNPDLIVLGGIFYHHADVLMPTIETTLREHAFADLGHKVQLETTSFGEYVGRIGAAAVALERLLYRPVDMALKQSYK